MSKLSFLVNFNAEVTTPYHCAPYQNDRAELVS